MMPCGEFHWFFWMWWRFCHRFGHSEICYIVTHFSTKEAKEKPHVMDMIFLPIFHTHQKGTFDFLSWHLKSCLIIRRCRYLWYLQSSVHYCTAFYTHITIRLRNSRTVKIAHNILDKLFPNIDSSKLGGYPITPRGSHPHLVMSI